MRNRQHDMLKIRPRSVDLPAGAVLARAAFDRPDLVDAYSVERAGLPEDPQLWADAVFHDPPGWVKALFGVRNGLVRLVGIPPGTSKAFDTLAVAGPELLLGQDDTHLDFRASILVTDAEVILSTVARANNRRGKLYLLVVRLFHPPVVRAMLARAARSFAVRAR